MAEKGIASCDLSLHDGDWKFIMASGNARVGRGGGRVMVVNWGREEFAIYLC